MLASRSFIPTLDRMITRELDRVFSPYDNGTGAARVWVPPMDVVESSEGYTIVTELPGLTPDKVDISFDRNTLTISGTKEQTIRTPEKGELRVFAAERAHGAFERTVRLPDYVDGDRIEATFEHGLLTIRIPKAEAAKPRKIAINAAPETPALENRVNG